MTPDNEINEEEKPMGKTEKESQVKEQLNLLEKASGRLGQTIDNLVEKLMPVLMPESDEAKGDTPEPELTPLANDIRTREKQIGYFNRKLRDVIDRLEL